MTEPTNETSINVDATIARLTEIEAQRNDLAAERDRLLESLKGAQEDLAAVLACYAGDDAPAPKSKKRAAKKTAKRKAAKKTVGAKKPRITDEQIATAVAFVQGGQAKNADPKALAAAKRKGLVTCSGRGRGATYSVAAPA